MRAAAALPGRGARTALVLWDADNCRPPLTLPPAQLAARLRATVAATSTSHPPTSPLISLFANPATAAALDLAAWTPAVVAGSRGAADQAVTAAAVAAVQRSADRSTHLTLALVSGDAAAFMGLLLWASAQPHVETVVIGSFHGEGKAGRPDAWRRCGLARAADHAVLWSEVVDGV
jgi:hypothetical protein